MTLRMEITRLWVRESGSIGFKEGITQKELAKAIGIDPTTLGFVERGVKEMSNKTMKKIECAKDNSGKSKQFSASYVIPSMLFNRV